MKTALLVVSILTVCVFAIISCSKPTDGGGSNGGGGSSAINCDGVAKTWTNDVSPIITTFCNQAGCHATGSSNGPGAITNYTQVFNNRSGIRAAIQSGSMPRNSTLTTAQKNSVLCWIDAGALNN